MNAVRDGGGGRPARPRCVLTSPSAPIPSLGGTAIRARSLIEALADDFDVTVVCSARLTDDARNQTRRACGDLGAAVVFIEDDAGGSPPGSLRATARALTGALSTMTEAWSVGPASGILEELVRDCDLVWAHRITPYLDRRMPVPPSGAVVVDVDDLEERVVARDRTLGVVRRTIRGRNLAHARHRLLAASTLALVCSDVDAMRLDSRCPVRVLPNTYPFAGVRTAGGDAGVGAGTGLVLLVGKMAYDPNRLGAEWLLREVWPIVRRRFPSARLLVVGDGSECLEGSVPAAGVELLGWVEDVAPIIRSASVVTAPIPYGSGTRLKILEGFAHRRPVVSTTAGAEGIEAVDGKSILIADDPVSFADCIVRMLEDPSMAERIGQRGGELFDERYSFERFRSTVLAIAREAIDRSNPARTTTGRVRR